MRALAAPNYNPEIVYQTCINSIKNCNLRARLNLATNNIVVEATNYEQKAKAKQLYSIPPNNCKNDEVVLGTVTKEELKDVYSSHMVEGSKNARNIYDTLLSQAPFSRCPFCGIGQVSTLDHYLPKAKYPQFSVLPSNLVPSCKDCNTRKNVAIATTAAGQSLHPYFDHQNFIDDLWLYAEVRETIPATIYFFVQAPDHWDNISKLRVKSHFNDFKLASRYSIEASDELSSLRSVLTQYQNSLGIVGIRQHLNIVAQSHAGKHTNSWQTAMFRALEQSDWYCNNGFL